jgi:hypothetical protein
MERESAAAHAQRDGRDGRQQPLAGQAPAGFLNGYIAV